MDSRNTKSTRRSCFRLAPTKTLILVFALAVASGKIADAQNGMQVSNPVDAPQPFVSPEELRVQISDITSIRGQQGNTITGLGLVTGLNGTGGKSQATRQMAANVLAQFGIIDAPSNSKSVAIVMVSAELPPFTRIGEKMTVHVSVYDDATSLKGGHLYLTPLKGVDDQIYATAEGPLTGSGFAVTGDAGSVQKNHPTTATAPARIVKEICVDNAFDNGFIDFLLTNKDELTSSRIASAINQLLPGNSHAVDAGMVRVRIPESFRGSRNAFIADLGRLTVVPNVPARVVINQRTGTIVIGARVRLSRVVFANDNLIVTTSENPTVSQPAPLSGGQTVVVPRTQITAVEEGGRYNLLSEGIEVGELATALNAMGVSPQDLITIFKSLEASGALHAEVVDQ